MILIHKETAQIYEVRIKSLAAESAEEIWNPDVGKDAYPIAEMSLFGGDPIKGLFYDQLNEQFEILGWL